MIRAHVLSSVLEWLLEGYPNGIPAKDYSPILALLRRQQLTDEEVRYVAARLVDQALSSDGVRQVTRDDVEREIASFTKEEPEDADIARVATRLGSPAWSTTQDQPSRAAH